MWCEIVNRCACRSILNETNKFRIRMPSSGFRFAVLLHCLTVQAIQLDEQVHGRRGNLVQDGMLDKPALELPDTVEARGASSSASAPSRIGTLPLQRGSSLVTTTTTTTIGRAWGPAVYQSSCWCTPCYWCGTRPGLDGSSSMPGPASSSQQCSKCGASTIRSQPRLEQLRESLRPLLRLLTRPSCASSCVGSARSAAAKAVLSAHRDERTAPCKTFAVEQLDIFYCRLNCLVH